MGMRIDENQPCRELNFVLETKKQSSKKVRFSAHFIIGSSYYKVTVDDIFIDEVTKVPYLHGWVYKTKSSNNPTPNSQAEEDKNYERVIYTKPTANIEIDDKKTDNNDIKNELGHIYKYRDIIINAISPEDVVDKLSIVLPGENIGLEKIKLFMEMRNSRYRALKIISDNPGIMASDFAHEFLPRTHSFNSNTKYWAGGFLARLKKMKFIEHRGSKSKKYWYITQNGQSLLDDSGKNDNVLF
ncbi:MAG: hypothetical protein ACYDEQ_07210 [Desulfocucumaceae bacterium]